MAKSFTSLMSSTFNPESLGGARKPLSEFSRELKSLTDTDKRDLAKLFVSEGYAPVVEVKFMDDTTEVFS